MSSPDDKRKRGKSTTAVHAGELATTLGEVHTPIYQTSTFYFPTDDPATWEGNVPEGTYIYSRYGNPTIKAAEDKLAALEGAERGMIFSSGMAAITATLMAFLRRGDHIVSVEDLYGGTYAFLREELPRFGVEVTMVRTDDLGALEGAITPRTRMIFLESPTNPLLKLVDIEGAAQIAQSKGIRSVIDSTFATPINTNPIELGVDLVCHSCTKYLNGHSDLVAGAVVGWKKDIEAIGRMRIQYGGSLDPLGAFLLARGMKTLDLRMERHNRNGMEMAHFLEGHPLVHAVHYPGLESHPQHALAQRQMRGFGGMVSFELSGREAAEKAVRRLKVVKKATSLGGVDSLVSMPLSSSHRSLPPQERARLGIKDGMIRLSLGIEDIEDLKTDIDQALN